MPPILNLTLNCLLAHFDIKVSTTPYFLLANTVECKWDKIALKCKRLGKDGIFFFRAAAVLCPTLNLGR